MVNGMIILTYVNDCVIVRLSMIRIDGVTQALKYGNEFLKLTDKGDINKFVENEKTHIDENRFNISHPFYIYRIISLLNIDNSTYGMVNKTKSTRVGNCSCTRTYKESLERKSGNTKLLLLY